MIVFLGALLVFSSILLAACAPVLVLAGRRGLPATRRRFLIAAGSIAMICAGSSAASSHLVSRCKDEVNQNYCVDYGSTGFQILIVTGFAVTAWVKVIELYRY